MCVRVCVSLHLLCECVCEFACASVPKNAAVPSIDELQLVCVLFVCLDTFYSHQTHALLVLAAQPPTQPLQQQRQFSHSCRDGGG